MSILFVILDSGIRNRSWIAIIGPENFTSKDFRRLAQKVQTGHKMLVKQKVHRHEDFCCGNTVAVRYLNQAETVLRNPRPKAAQQKG